MGEYSDKVRDIRELPLFPLNIVLFPNVPLPLHIFEPRYQQMVKDVRETNDIFGISYFDSSVASLNVPPVGHVGCAAEIRDLQALPDDRSNIIAVGLVRYHVESYVAREEPYLVGRVNFFEDEEDSSAALSTLARETGSLFVRIAQAIRILNDTRTYIPDLSDTEPAHLSFLISATLDMEPEFKLELLELTSTSQRLEKLYDYLAKVVDSYENRSRAHEIAQTNGRVGKFTPPQ